MDERPSNPDRLRVAAISFLNPAPLLWDFEQVPMAEALLRRYDIHYTKPSLCAAELADGTADLGLVPIGALPFIPGVAVIPGCTIASLHAVRSIQLVLRKGLTLRSIRTIAIDSASRSSSAYVRILLHAIGNTDVEFLDHAADLSAMLQICDAALLIGDPALLALQQREDEGAFADCTWHDVATLWSTQTGLPWVAAVWAVRTDALRRTGISDAQLASDLTASRDHGLGHIEEIVALWRPRIALPESTLRCYLTRNIHYRLDDRCLEGIRRFYKLAHDFGVLPAYTLPLLTTGPTNVATFNEAPAS